MRNNADVNARANDGEAPLHIAVRARHKDVVQFLLANKADVNARDDKSKSPLDLVALDL